MAQNPGLIIFIVTQRNYKTQKQAGKPRHDRKRGTMDLSYTCAAGTSAASCTRDLGGTRVLAVLPLQGDNDAPYPGFEPSQVPA